MRSLEQRCLQSWEVLERRLPECCPGAVLAPTAAELRRLFNAAKAATP